VLDFCLVSLGFIQLSKWFYLSPMSSTHRNDSLIGGDLRDFLKGGNESDIVRRGAGGDYVVGGKVNDSVFGQGGNDRVGGGGDDDLGSGGDGDDILVGGFGKDSLAGGVGQGRFVLNTGSFFEASSGMTFRHTSPNASEVDLVVDFTPNVDKLVMNGVPCLAALSVTDATVNCHLGALVATEINGNLEFIVFVQGATAPVLLAGGGTNFVFGESAETFSNNANNPDYFYANPDMATMI
jgi:Ca2+-binding RTX toxin-like protein